MSVLRKSTLALSVAGLVSAHAVAADSTHEQLTRIAEDVVHTMAKLDPMQATYLGIAGFDDALDVPSEAARSADIARLRAWSARVDAVTKAAGASISLVDRDDATLLHAQLDGRLDELLLRQDDRKNYAAPALAIAGVIFTQFLHLPVPGREDATQADLDHAWGDLVARMAKAPA